MRALRSLGEAGSSRNRPLERSGKIISRREITTNGSGSSKIGNRQYVAILILSSLMLAGCISKNKEPEDNPISPAQIEMCLSRARPPQQFGFSIFAVEGGIAYAGRGRLHPNHFAYAEMHEENIPVIKMRGRSKRDSMNVLVDTSSPVSWMEFSTSQDFRAFFMGINDEVIPYRGSYNTGGTPAFAAVVTQLRIDTLFIESVPFYIRMAEGSLGPLARGIRKPEVDAVMGYDNLRSFEYIQFDLQNNSIAFSATHPYKPNEALLLEAAKIVAAPGQGLMIEGMVDEEITPITLDFAGNYSLARNGIKTGTTRHVELGHMPFDDVPTLVLPTHTAPPRVGRKLLAPYLITICNKEGMVYFEQIPDVD
ncbi:MAG: hypothetical protein ABFR33_01070 [Verrucomicrobiota bacterium]